MITIFTEIDTQTKNWFLKSERRLETNLQLFYRYLTLEIILK